VTYTVISLLDIKGMVVIRGFKGFLEKPVLTKNIQEFWFFGSEEFLPCSDKKHTVHGEKLKK
jgi:hypothetical protein